MPSLLLGPIRERIMRGTAFTTALPLCQDKVITAFVLDDNTIRVTFADGVIVEIMDTGQSCCEYRYMHTDDDVSYYIGAKLHDVEQKEGPTTNDGGTKECEFLIFTTSRGSFTVCSYNEHNGYYGGISIIDHFA